MSVDSDVLLNLKHLLMKGNEWVPHFLASLESEHEQYLKVGDNIGCSYSSSFGHIITNCPKLEAVNKTNVNIGRKDYLTRALWTSSCACASQWSHALSAKNDSCNYVLNIFY